MHSFYDDLKDNLREGLLLLIKYGLIIAAVVYAFNFSINTANKANNGEQAAILLVELQKKGYLPQLVNGQVPDKIVQNTTEKK